MSCVARDAHEFGLSVSSDQFMSLRPEGPKYFSLIPSEACDFVNRFKIYWQAHDPQSHAKLHEQALIKRGVAAQRNRRNCRRWLILIFLFGAVFTELSSSRSLRREMKRRRLGRAINDNRDHGLTADSMALVFGKQVVDLRGGALGVHGVHLPDCQFA